MDAESRPLEQTPIWREVKPIIQSEAKPIKYEYRGQLHMPKEDIPIFKIL
jgi:hypothetical protein